MFTELELHQIFIVEGQILNCCGPLFFLHSHELRPENVNYNGSFGLVDTGQKRLLVTCHHVLDEFHKLRDSGHVKEMSILLGVGYPIRLAESQLIDSDERLDLATFDMETLLPHCSKRNFYPIYSSPAPVLKPNDILALIGYVGSGRTTSAAGADFRYEALGLSVADVNGIRVVADLSKTKRDSDIEEKDCQATVSIGGTSGSPCFKLSKNLKLDLAAFVTSEVLKTLHMTHAKCILPDGRLDRTLA